MVKSAAPKIPPPDALDDALSIIARRAPELRAAGVTGVSVGEIRVDLAAASPVAGKGKDGDAPPATEADIASVADFRRGRDGVPS